LFVLAYLAAATGAPKKKKEGKGGGTGTVALRFEKHILSHFGVEAQRKGEEKRRRKSAFVTFRTGRSLLHKKKKGERKRERKRGARFTTTSYQGKQGCRSAAFRQKGERKKEKKKGRGEDKKWLGISPAPQGTVQNNEDRPRGRDGKGEKEAGPQGAAPYVM